MYQQETTNDDEMLTNTLTILGLSKSEQDMYALLMEIQSPQPVFIIALEHESSRQTTNSILKRMTKKGIVIKSKHHGISCFHTNYKQLEKLIDSTISQLENAKKILAPK